MKTRTNQPIYKDDGTLLTDEDLGGGTEVVANPTLAGSEVALTGLQVGDTKYAVSSGSEIHLYKLGSSGSNLFCITNKEINNEHEFYNYIREHEGTSASSMYGVFGSYVVSEKWYVPKGCYGNSYSSYVRIELANVVDGSGMYIDITSLLHIKKVF